MRRTFHSLGSSDKSSSFSSSSPTPRSSSSPASCSRFRCRFCSSSTCLSCSSKERSCTTLRTWAKYAGPTGMSLRSANAVTYLGYKMGYQPTPRSLTRDGISLRGLLFPVGWKGRRNNRESDNVSHDDKTEVSTRIFRSPVLFACLVSQKLSPWENASVDGHVIDAFRVVRNWKLGHVQGCLRLGFAFRQSTDQVSYRAYVGYKWPRKSSLSKTCLDLQSLVCPAFRFTLADVRLSAGQ